MYSFSRKKVCISRWLLSSVTNLVEFTNCLMSTVFNEYSLKLYGYFLHPFSTRAVFSTCCRCFQLFSVKCKFTSRVTELSKAILADTTVKRLMSWRENQITTCILLTSLQEYSQSPSTWTACFLKTIQHGWVGLAFSQYSYKVSKAKIVP